MSDTWGVIAWGAVRCDDTVLRDGDVFDAACQGAFAVAPSMVVLIAKHDAPEFSGGVAEPRTARVQRSDMPWYHIAIGLVVQVVSAALQALPALWIAPLIDDGLLYRDSSRLSLLSAALCIAAVWLAAATVVQRPVLINLVIQIRRRWTRWAWRAALQQAAQSTDGVAGLSERLRERIRRLVRVAARGPLLMQDSIVVPLHAALIVYLNPRFAAVGAFGAVALLLMGGLWNRSRARVRRRMESAFGVASAWGAAQPSAMAGPIRRFRTQLDAVAAAAGRAYQRLGLGRRFYAQAARTVHLIFLLTVGSQWVMAQRLSLGVLLTSCALWDGLIAAAARCLTLRPLLMPRRRRPKPAALQGPIHHGGRGQLDIDAVTVHYPESSSPILRNVSMQVQPGATHVIVGESGAGKTTLARVLARLTSVTSGDLRLDGRTLDSLEDGRIAVVWRTPWMVDGTVRDNITLGDGQVRTAAAQWAAQVVGVPAFSHGLDTPLGRHGTHLCRAWSVRLAVARALARRPTLLVLDDTFFGLDDADCLDLLQRLEACSPRPTLLVLTQPRAIWTSRQAGVLHAGQWVPHV